MLAAMMRRKLKVNRLAVICGTVSRLIASTMPTSRSVETMVMAMSAMSRYSITLTGRCCERAKVLSNDMERMVR